MTPTPPRYLLASRRSVLLGGMGATVAATLTACGRSSATPRTPVPLSSTAPLSAYVGDLRTVALGAAVENLAVQAYTLVRARATSGGYGPMPPAVTTFLTTAQAHHRDHARAWNALLTQAERPAVTGTPLRDAPALLGPLTAATTIRDLSTAAGALELALAETCLAAVGTVTDSGALTVAAGIGPVEAQHVAVLNLFLATAPVPQSTLQTGSAVSADTLTA